MAEKVEVLKNGMVYVVCTDGTSLTFTPDCDVDNTLELGKEILERIRGN